MYSVIHWVIARRLCQAYLLTTASKRTESSEWTNCETSISSLINELPLLISLWNNSLSKCSFIKRVIFIWWFTVVFVCFFHSKAFVDVWILDRNRNKSTNEKDVCVISDEDRICDSLLSCLFLFSLSLSLFIFDLFDVMTNAKRQMIGCMLCI